MNLQDERDGGKEGRRRGSLWRGLRVERHVSAKILCLALSDVIWEAGHAQPRDSIAEGGGMVTSSNRTLVEGKKIKRDPAPAIHLIRRHLKKSREPSQEKGKAKQIPQCAIAPPGGGGGHTT